MKKASLEALNATFNGHECSDSMRRVKNRAW